MNSQTLMANILGYQKCLTIVSYVSEGGDSGSPVFVRKSSSNTDVYLVGVHFGDYTQSRKRFIPIDRVYAESLKRGYDWKPIELRVVPVLDDTEGNNPIESVRFEQSDTKITAQFGPQDIGSAVLYYRAALSRGNTNMSTTVANIGEASIVEVTDSQGITIQHKASFDVSGLSASEKMGTWTVRVRACTDPAGTTCGGYGSAGSGSATK